MIRAPKYKICRRLGPIHEKCQTQKFVLSQARRGRSDKRPKQLSDFGLQLIEKQKIRLTYGVTEKQFSNYVEAATKAKGMAASLALFESLERRLDNVVYRLGLASTRALARQMVAHGHIVVNGKKITVPSYAVKVGNKVEVREGSKKSVLFADLEKRLKSYATPSWLTFDLAKGEASVSALPKTIEGGLDFNSVLEFYSR